MHVLIAPDSFKQSLSARRAAEAIARGVRSACPNATADPCPIADGGEGTVDALVAATGGAFHTHRVTGPLGEPVDAQWGTLGDGATAVIEMAAAAGMHLVPHDRRDPTATTTFGVGELIRRALDAGCRRVIVGLGGSATCDGGLGMAQALGANAACGLARPLTGGDLMQVTAIDLGTRDPRFNKTELVVACDVTNPLVGPDGAAHVYAPQKGATPAQVAQLDAGLAHLAQLLGVDPMQAGFGAAGGLGFGMVVFAGATMRRGVELVLDAVGFDQRVQQADLVITGEGRLDAQSLNGKATIGVAQRAAQFGVPTIAIAGCAGDGAERCLQHGLSRYETLVGAGVTLEQALADAEALLVQRAAAVISDWRA